MASVFPPYEPTPEQELTGDLMRLQEGWEALGIDADDFLKCAVCHKWIADLVVDTEPPLTPDELCECTDDDIAAWEQIPRGAP